MPSVIQLPIRANAIQYDEDTVQEVLDMLEDVTRGQGIVVDDEQQDTEQKARTRAKVMVEALHAITEDRKFKTHAVETEDGKFYAVVSEQIKK